MKLYDEEISLKGNTFTIREVQESDKQDLLQVYGDKNALPFFNGDNCEGDIFYYNTSEKIDKAFDFWKYSKENKWFRRLSIVHSSENRVIGTVELCYRGKDEFSDSTGILRVDVQSGYEEQGVLQEIFSLITSVFLRLIDGSVIITKIPSYAVERIAAASQSGYTKSPIVLTGHKGEQYYDYWVHAS